MGVNGIYGLSGSGLDVESMVKVGMLSKQSEYDKIQQKYTSNEYKKSELLEVYGELQTFNASTLSQYKMSNNMNARGASSSNSSAVGASANSNAAIMTHYVSVDELASNAYLIGTKMERVDNADKDKNQLSSLLFKSIKEGVDGKVEVTLADGSSKTFNASDTAIFFSLDDGKNGLLATKDSNTVVASATPEADAGTHTVKIDALAQPANESTTNFASSDTFGTTLLGWSANGNGNIDSTFVKFTSYFDNLAANTNTALAFTVSDGTNSSEIKYTYAELKNLVNGTNEAFVDSINSKIGSDVKVQASIVDGKLTFTNTSNATGSDSQVIISFDQAKLDAAKNARTGNASDTDTYASSILAIYNSSCATAIITATSGISDETDKAAKTAAYTSAYAIYKNCINSGTTPSEPADISNTAWTAAYKVYSDTAVNGVADTTDTALKAAVKSAYTSRNSNTALDAAYTSITSNKSDAEQAAYSSYGSDTDLGKAQKAAYTSITSNKSGAEQAAYSSYGSDTDLGKAQKAAYDSITNGITDTVEKAVEKAVYKAYGTNQPDTAATLTAAYTSITNSKSGAEQAAYSSYGSDTDLGNALTAAYTSITNSKSGAEQAAYSSYGTSKNTATALTAAYNVLKTDAGEDANNTNTAIGAAYAEKTTNSSVALTAAYNTITNSKSGAEKAAYTAYKDNISSGSEAAKTAAYNAYTAYTANAGSTLDSDAVAAAATAAAANAANDYAKAKEFGQAAASAYSNATTYAGNAETAYTDTALNYATNAQNDYNKATNAITAAQTAYTVTALNYASAAQTAYTVTALNYASAAQTDYNNIYNIGTFTSTVQSHVSNATSAYNNAKIYANSAQFAAETSYTDAKKNSTLNNLFATSSKFDSIAVTFLEKIAGVSTAPSTVSKDTSNGTTTITFTGANAKGTVDGADISSNTFTSDGNSFTVGDITYTAKGITTGTTVTNLGNQNIKITYEDLLNGFTFNEFASKINSQSTNVRATYDTVQDRFSIYNKESGKTNVINIGIVDDDDATSTNEAKKIVGTNTEKLFDAFGFQQSASGELVGEVVDFEKGDKTTLSGKNGSAKIDGIEYDLESNKTTVNGVTYDFLNKTTGNVTVSVTQDTDKIIEKVKSFVSDYNALMKKLYEWYDEKPNSDYKPLTATQKESMKDEQIEKWEEKAKAGLLYHDKTLSKVISDLRSAISEKVDGISGKYNNIFSIGISTTGLKGQLKLDEDKLKAALVEDADSVYDIFAKLDKGETQYLVKRNGKQIWTTTKEDGDEELSKKTVERSSYNGIAQRLGDVFINSLKSVKSVSGSSADVTEDSELNNLMRELQTKMSNFRKMMASFEKQLYKKYDAMEQALALLGAQLNYVTSAFQ